MVVKKKQVSNIKDNLEKEKILLKSDNKLKMNKKELNLFKLNPDDYLKGLNDDELVDFIQYLNYSYYIDGVSLLSDELYDYVKEELRKRNSNHALLKTIGVSNINKTQLPYYMGSMDKIKNDEKSLNNWIKKYPNDNSYVFSEDYKVYQLIAKKDIFQNDEITVNYNVTHRDFPFIGAAKEEYNLC